MGSVKRIKVQQVLEPIEISDNRWFEAEPVLVNRDTTIGEFAKNIKSKMIKDVIVISKVYKVLIKCDGEISQVTARMNYDDEYANRYAAAMATAFLSYIFGLNASVTKDVFEACLNELEK